MNLRNKNGSITIFVLVGLLFMSAFLVISYANNVNRSKIAKEQSEIINSIYQTKVLSTNEIYDRLTAVPTITINKSESTKGVMEIIIESNGITEDTKIEYKIDNNVFNSKEDFYEYVNNNISDGEEKELTIKATNDIGNTEEITETVKFVRPKIETLPTPIITNITPVQSSYVTYDEVNKKEETYTILDLNETYNTMTEVVARADQWLFDNKQYEVETPIKVVAKGNNNLISESTQTIKFIRGVKVANESEFSTALASTSPSYIQLANDIACTNTISVDGVTHKLDLNNKIVSKTVANESFTFITLGSNTNLTIIDSSSEKNGTILAKLSEPNNDTGSSDARLNTIYTINNQGTLNIESGTVASDLVQKVGEPNKNIHVKDLAKTIKNTGTVNLTGGSITSNAITQGASDSATRNGEATAIGIENTGTVNLNSGNITCYAEANMRMTSIIYGETRAYAYGVTNSGGTVNRNDGVTISVTAVANDEDSYTETKDSAEIEEV